MYVEYVFFGFLLLNVVTSINLFDIFFLIINFWNFVMYLSDEFWYVYDMFWVDRIFFLGNKVRSEYWNNIEGNGKFYWSWSWVEVEVLLNDRLFDLEISIGRCFVICFVLMFLFGESIVNIFCCGFVKDYFSILKWFLF